MIRVDGHPFPWRADLTLADVMAEVDPDQAVAVVRLDDRLVSKPNFAVTRVPDGAVLHLIPLVAGG